jgi:hypothetical protein
MFDRYGDLHLPARNSFRNLFAHLWFDPGKLT